jgi:hypothetical protein
MHAIEKNVKAFVVANPGRLQKEAVRTSDVRDALGGFSQHAE